MNYILKADGLNTFYGRSHILFDVSLSVSAGETVCLMGRNGAGKTTTFRSLMGLTPPEKGTVIFKDKPCAGRLHIKWPEWEWVSSRKIDVFLGLSRFKKTLSWVRYRVEKASGQCLPFWSIFRRWRCAKTDSGDRFLGVSNRC